MIYTSEGNAYPSTSFRTSLHLPGVIVAESAAGETRYLLSDGLGSIRQAVDENAEVVSYHEFDPYGNPVRNNGGEPYGYTGEWWEGYNELLHLRARWYAPETGTFLSRDPVESEPPYQYVRGNPINRIDPSGFHPPSPSEPPLREIELVKTPSGYLEGYILSGTFLHCLAYIYGREIVYDFNTGERAIFEYTDKPAFVLPFIRTGVAGVELTTRFGGSGAVYSGYLWGFKRNFINNDPLASIREYEGPANSLSFEASVSPPMLPIVSGKGGATFLTGTTEPVKGLAFYAGGGASEPSLPLEFDLSLASVKAELGNEVVHRYNNPDAMANDIRNGLWSPVQGVVTDLALDGFRAVAAHIVTQFAPADEWGDPVPPPASPYEPENCIPSYWGGCIVEITPLDPPPDPSAEPGKGKLIEITPLDPPPDPSAEPGECKLIVGGGCVARW